MTKPILHHYPLSPYAEKIRRMLAYCECPYNSVETSPMLPRKDLDQLTGGYRRIPVAQWGADIYCDTRAIAERIAANCNKPELAPSKQTTEQAEFIARVDGDLFFALVGLAFGGALKQKMKQEFGLIRLLRFAWDRMKLMKGAKPTPKGDQAKAMVQAHLSDMEARLSQPFVFGDIPTLADFTAYHGLWFLYAVGEHPGIENYPNIQAWMAKMAALGSTHVEDITAADSLRIAGKASPIEQSAGKEVVSIVPDDYGVLPVSGQLVREDELEYVIARQSKKAGLVHVHFPRQGFKRQ